MFQDAAKNALGKDASTDVQYARLGYCHLLFWVCRRAGKAASKELAVLIPAPDAPSFEVWSMETSPFSPENLKMPVSVSFLFWCTKVAVYFTKLWECVKSEIQCNVSPDGNFSVELKYTAGFFKYNI